MTKVASAAGHPLSPGATTWALLDANAMIPPRLGDMLFDMNEVGLYRPRWTANIEQEFVTNFPPVVFGKTKAERKAIKERPSPEQIQAAQGRLAAFRGSAGPEHEVFGYRQPEYRSQVPSGVDPKDVHVIAAAIVIKAYADRLDKVYVVSANVSHLDKGAVAKLGIEVLSPGQFIDAMAKTGDPRFEEAMAQTIRDRAGKRTFGKEDLLACLLTHKAKKAFEHLSKRWNMTARSLGRHP
jgi:hypothetical protein